MTAQNTLLTGGLFTGLVANGPDTTFNGHGKITANNKLVYLEPGARPAAGQACEQSNQLAAHG